MTEKFSTAVSVTPKVTLELATDGLPMNEFKSSKFFNYQKIK